MCVEGSGVETLIKLKEKGDCVKLKNIISFDAYKEELKERADKVGVRVMSYADVIEEGKRHIPKMDFKEPTGDTIYIVCYTSGTTGDPKGSLIPHSYFVACGNIVEYF
jgi:long-chain acyl-CoA synthetase